jgi:hypothetical protein
MMARIRTVKPEFFKHYDLFKAEKETKLPLRLAFQGLWLCADKEGRFKFNPTHLKLDILPYDEVDFRVILAALEAYGFIFKYDVSGKRYGLIPTLKDHQRFSGTEAKAVSTLPEPPKDLKSGISMEELRNLWGSAMELPRNYHEESFDFELYEQKELPSNFQGTSEERRKGKEGKGKEEGKERDALSQDFLGVVCYDAEKEILANQSFFEQVCISTKKDSSFAKESLRKYHLWLLENDKYPRGKKALFAGFEKWLRNEKNIVNGATAGQGIKQQPDGPPLKRIN